MWLWSTPWYVFALKKKNRATPLLQPAPQARPVLMHRQLAAVSETKFKGILRRKKPIRQSLWGRKWRSESSLFRLLLFRFITHTLGAPVILLLQRNLFYRLSLVEKLQVHVDQRRVLRYVPLRVEQGPAGKARRKRYIFRHFGPALNTSLLLKDPQLLINWLRGRLRFMSLFRHRRFFRIVGLFLRMAVNFTRPKFKLKGVYLYLVGKISVTGNARSRSFFATAGSYSLANLTLRLNHAFSIVRTKTGCLGLTIYYLH